MGKGIITILERETKGKLEGGIQKTLNIKTLVKLSGLNRQTVTRSLRMSPKEREIWALRSKTIEIKYTTIKSKRLYVTKKAENVYWIDCLSILLSLR